MKPHLTKVSLALLSTVFLLGCQEQGSSPVGPEGLGPGFDKKDSGTCTTPVNGHCHGDDGDTGGDNPGSQTYDITFAIDGDITTDPTTVNTGPGRENSQGGQVGFDACCGGGKLILTSALLVDVAGGAQTCFGVGDLTLDDFIGTFYPDKKDMNEAEARFLFDANDRDGNPGVRYKLTLTGTAVGDVGAVFPPEPGTSMTVTYSNTFKINAQRTKEKNACSSDGFIDLTNDISVLVEGIS